MTTHSDLSVYRKAYCHKAKATNVGIAKTSGGRGGVNMLYSSGPRRERLEISLLSVYMPSTLFYQGPHRLKYGSPFPRSDLFFSPARPVQYSVYIHGMGPEVPSNKGWAIPSHLGDIPALGLFENARLVHRRGDVNSF